MTNDMDATTRQLIEAIHAGPRQCVLALTGGGTTAAASLLAVPGGSRTVLEVQVPYDEASLCGFLGRRPEQFCSAETARLMARRAYECACWLAPGHEVVGLGCTASLASDRPKKGPHRGHVAVQTALRVTTLSLTFTKGARDREGEEAVLTALVLNALAEAFGVGPRLPVPVLPGEQVETETAGLADALTDFLRGDLPVCGILLDAQASAQLTRPEVLLAGSFNPLHDGHWRLGDVATQLLGKPVVYELSVTNVDKPPLAAEEVRRRARQFTWQAPLWLTRAPTFLEKAELFPGATFVVGADTAERLVAPRYYQDSEDRRNAALDRIRALGGRFLVAGRTGLAGSFVGLDDLALPPAYRDLFRAIPREQFECPLSSTSLREQAVAALPTDP